MYTDACKDQKKAESSISPDGHLVVSFKFFLQYSIFTTVKLVVIKLLKKQHFFPIVRVVSIILPVLLAIFTDYEVDGVYC